MLRHVVCFRWRDDATDVQKEGVREALAALPAEIPEIATYHLGPDVGIRDASWDFALVAEFATREDFLTYTAHPAHVAVVETHINPIVEERVSVQFET